MSMITTGTSELGCIIKGDDMNYFVKKYTELNPIDFEREIEELDLTSEEDRKAAEEYVWEWLDTNEAFKYSRDANKEDGEVFYARIIRDDPYYPWLYHLPIADALEYRQEDPDLIFVNADKCCCAKTVLRGDFYKSKDELVQEFKDKLEKYVPENFDWTANIGDLDYAIFG